MMTLAAVSAAGLFMAAPPAAAWAAGSNTSNTEPAMITCPSPVDGNYYEWIAFTGTDGQINLMTYNTSEGYRATTDDSISSPT